MAGAFLWGGETGCGRCRGGLRRRDGGFELGQLVESGVGARKISVTGSSPPRDGPGGRIAGAGCYPVCSQLSTLLRKVHQSGEIKVIPRAQKNVPRRQPGAIRLRKAADDLSISFFPNDANFLPNTYFQGMSNKKCKSEGKKEKW